MGETYAIEIVVLSDEFFQLRLDVDDAFGGEFELDDGDSCFFEVFEEADFGWLKEH